MPLEIIHSDILDSKCQCIVDPTDESYSGSGGTDLAIHKAAGRKLDDECEALPPLTPGEARYTSAYNIDCKYIIHTFGPMWFGGKDNEEIILRSCYLNCLILAARLNVESIAFPLISSGTFGFPKDKVLKIATEAISDLLFTNESDISVVLCVFDKESFEISERFDLDAFLERHKPKGKKVVHKYVSKPICSAPIIYENDSCFDSESEIKYAAPQKRLKPISELDEWLKVHDDNFAVTLLKLIDQKGMKDVECYKKANISRKTFSKINNEANYRPSKQTVAGFAISLHLNLEETQALMKTAGYSLSHIDKFDLIIEFFIVNEIYDVHEVNAALYKYDLPCIGC